MTKLVQLLGCELRPTFWMVGYDPLVLVQLSWFRGAQHEEAKAGVMCFTGWLTKRLQVMITTRRIVTTNRKHEQS